MVKIKKVLFVLMMINFSLSSLLYAASVKAMVDTIEVIRGNPVTLRIKAVGDNPVFPEIKKIANTPVATTSQSTSRNLSIINGSMKSEQSVTKIIQFIPEENMTIPSYAVNIDGVEYRTDPIDITVVKENTNYLQNNEIFSLVIRSNKDKVVMGESFVVTLYFSLKQGVQLTQDVQYTPPNLSSFMTVDVSNQKSYSRGAYNVQEIRYILTPLKEGNFTIGPAEAKIGLPDRSRRDIFGLSYATKWIQTNSNSLQIEVLPLEVESDLVGNFRIDTSIDTTNTKVNKPVNMVLTIEGNGSLDGFEFPEYQIDGVTVYSDDAKKDSKVVDGEIYTKYSKSFAFISQSNFVIPSRDLTLYNPKTKEKKILKVKGFDIVVEGSKKEIAKRNLSVSETPKENNQDISKTDSKESDETEALPWWICLLAFVLGILSVYVAKQLRRWLGAKEKSYKQTDALKILYGHMDQSKEVEEMVRKLYARKRGDKSVQIDKKKLKEMLKRFR